MLKDTRVMDIIGPPFTNMQHVDMPCWHFSKNNNILDSFNVDFIDSEFEGLMWLKFKSKLSNFTLVLALCYIPPVESCRALDSDLYFQKLSQQVYIYQK